MTIPTIIAMTVFPAIAIYAAVMDLFTMTIPNKISLALVAIFAGLVPFMGLEVSQIGGHIAVGVATLAVGIGLFSMGWVGGGDVKFLSAIALWFGPSQILELVLISAVFGGVLTLAILGFRSIPLPAGAVQHDWVERLYNKQSGIPYGIAMAAAALALFPATIWMKVIV